MEKRHITVCICTFKRPDLLRKLLSELVDQATRGLFTYSIVITDNDINKSAQQVVQAFRETSILEVVYCVEPVQNISLARNKAVEEAKGDFIALIDDDEFPEKEWLLKLFLACEKYQSDGVLGPVAPYFEKDCPGWIVKGGLCEKSSYPTGTVLRATDTRTSNVLLKRELFEDPDNRFDPQFGRTGGEDVWFFLKVIEKGSSFVWCNEAVVHEIVPPERWTASFQIRKFIRIGGQTGEEVRKKGLPGRGFIRELAIFSIYALALPLSPLLGKHIFMWNLVKSAYHFAWLSGYLGYVFIRLRDD